MKAILALLAVLLLAGSNAHADQPSCDGYDDLIATGSPLPHLASALVPNGRVAILALGSASILGPGGSANSQAPAPTRDTRPSPPFQQSANDKSFAEIMARALEAAVAGSKVDMTVRGGRGLTAADQLRLLEDSLREKHYELVLWQTGTVEAVRNLPPSDFAQTLATGAAAIEATGANLVLVDPQFSRFLQTNSDIEPYEQALEQVGSLPGVMFFHRFGLMRAWANDGIIDLERTPKGDRTRAVERLHACLGQQLARALLSSTRS